MLLVQIAFESSIRHKVKKVVVLSTDKAVYPLMHGYVKRLMEKVMIAKSRISNQNSYMWDKIW